MHPSSPAMSQGKRLFEVPAHVGFWSLANQGFNRNIMATTYAVAEKGADLIKKDMKG